VAQVS